MYAGTTLHTKSGNIMGGHQKIDRLARRTLRHIAPRDAVFPAIRDILHFEGNNGPDGIKRKSPSQDEPWHFYDPLQPQKGELLMHIEDHMYNLSTALKKDDIVRASFEAAWLAHTIVDGLTPAHHYPLEEKIEELWGMSKDERTSVRDKNIIRGISKRDTLSKNWQYWGRKGVFTTHIMFEFGVATAISSIKELKKVPSPAEIERVHESGYINYFQNVALAIHKLGLYNEFHKEGWGRKFAKDVRTQLLPPIVNAVALAWLVALEQANQS